MTQEGIKPSKWSSEWYQLTSAEELQTVLREAKQLSHRRGAGRTRKVWEERIRKIEQELIRREATEEEWDTEEYEG